MQSVNFEFLRAKRPELADLGGFAEQYVHTDPVSSLVKLRTIAEQVVNAVYAALRLPKPLQPSLNDLLNGAAFKQAVPQVVYSKLHTIRIQGNKAAHGDSPSAQIAAWVLQEAYDLSRWLHLNELNQFLKI